MHPFSFLLCKRVSIAGDAQPGLPHRLCHSSAFCLDEAYEFLEGLGLLGQSQKGEGGKTASLNASALNRLIQAGVHKRGTRTGTSSNATRPVPVNVSVCQKSSQRVGRGFGRLQTFAARISSTPKPIPELASTNFLATWRGLAANIYPCLWWARSRQQWT